MKQTMKQTMNKLSLFKKKDKEKTVKYGLQQGSAAHSRVPVVSKQVV